jgi:hypothetical protein
MPTLSALLVHPHGDPRAEKLLDELGRFGISDARASALGAEAAIAECALVVDCGGRADEIRYAAAAGKQIIRVDLSYPAIDTARLVTAAIVAGLPRGPVAFFLDQRGEGRRTPAVPTAFAPLPTFVIRPDGAHRDRVPLPDLVATTIYRARETVSYLRELPSGLREVHLAGNAQPAFMAALGGLFQRTDGTRRVVHGPSGEWIDEAHLPFVPSFPRRPSLVYARSGRDQLLYVGSDVHLEDAILEGRRRELSVSYLSTRPTGGDWVKALLDGIEAFVAEREDPRARLVIIWTAAPPLLALAAGRLAEPICPYWGILELDPTTGRYVDHAVASFGAPLRADRRNTLPPMAGEGSPESLAAGN